jgi:hypothetical protein
MPAAAAVLAVGLLLAPTAVARSAFRAAVDYHVGTGPESVALADFNGDGRADIVTGGSADVSVLLSGAGGGFARAVREPAGDTPMTVAIGDLNGDGHNDIAAARAGDAGGISVLLGRGDGTFEPAATTAAPSGAYSLALADLNGCDTAKGSISQGAARHSGCAHRRPLPLSSL